MVLTAYQLLGKTASCLVVAFLVSVATSERVHLCRHATSASRYPIDAASAEKEAGDYHIHVSHDGVAPLDCEDLSPPIDDGDFLSFLVVPQNDDAFAAVKDLGESYPKYAVGDSVFVVHSKPKELQDLHQALYQSDIEALQVIAAQPVRSRQFSIAKSHLSQKEVEDRDKFVSTVSAMGSEFISTLEDLTGEGNLNIKGRCSYSPDHVVAAHYINDYFNDLGYESGFQDFSFSGVNTQNVIAVKQGSKNPDEVVVIGGHYDSTSENCASAAPGAVDNGSGCTMTMLLAKAATEFTFERTVHFICFGGEEQGLYGSTHYTNVNGSSVVAALTADMISYSNAFYGVTIEGTRNSDIQRLMGIAEKNAYLYSPDLSVSLSNYSFGSDHVPFQRAGIPAILYIEKDDTRYECYHRTCDTMQYVNGEQSMDISKTAAGTLWEVANGMF